ncbi:hypothetical protein D3C87_260570 [compost metagenome]
MTLRKAFLLFLLLSSTTSAFADQGSKGESFTAYVENDTRRIGGPGSDEGYSSGLRFSYVYAEDRVPSWVPPLTDWSPSLGEQFRKSTTNFGISLAHQIFTPDDTSSTELIVDDRPYAAWLYVGLTASFQTESHSHSLELDIGVIGPAALGEQVQNSFHSAIDTESANGWDHQLDNEPTLQLSYQQRLRFLQVTNNENVRIADLIPYFGGAFGNVLIGAHAGAIVRMGYNIPDDYGPTRPSSIDGDPVFIPRPNRSLEQWGAYGFAGIRGNAIVHNIFLDGSIFQPSHSVTKYPFNGETEFGVGVHYEGWSGVWRYVTKSPEFEERSKFNSFASISISYSRDLP